jgi:hypothetical protein
MRFITQSERSWELERYLRYVSRSAAKFPAGARAFVCQDWHYDITHHQCPHDSWVEELVVRELSSAERHQNRCLAITARFLGAYHDGISY